MKLVPVALAILLVAAGPQSSPSVADLLAGYVEWIDGRRASFELPNMDLNDARGELGRIAPAFLRGKSKVAELERQRQLLMSFTVELAQAGSIRQAAAAARLIEWACPYVRGHKPASDFDRAWQLAALAVLEGGINARTLETHLDHAQPVYPDEPRFVLARAIVQEQSTAPAEAVHGMTNAGSSTAALAAEHARAAERAILRFREAQADDTLRAEASVRLGHVQLVLGRPDEALAALSGIDNTTKDRALLYLSRLFRGLAYEARGRPTEAATAYRSALETSPGAHSATMRLAALWFRTGYRAEADDLLKTLLSDNDPRRDPWWSYYAADFRFWFPRIDRVRTLLKGAASTPGETSPPAIDRPAFRLERASLQQRPVFRSGADAVTIPVSVREGTRPVGGLTAGDFELRDNGVVQKIESFIAGQVPIDLTFVLDLSGSVDGPLLQRLKAAVRDTTKLLRPDDRVRLIAVSQVLREVFGLRAPGQGLPIDDLRALGATSLYDGLAASMMATADAGRRQLVIAFTDGRDSTSIVDEATAMEIARLSDAVVDIVVPVDSGNDGRTRSNPTNIAFGPRSSGTTPIVVGSSTDMAERSRALQPWARRDAIAEALTALVGPTSGQVFTPDSAEPVSGVFKRVLEDFRASYVLQYAPSGVAIPGWHEVTVTVKKPGRYDVRARRGYTGPRGSFPLATDPDTRPERFRAVR
jgi:VWFA-related protein